MSEAEKPRVLVIDDDELALVVMRRLLEAENCEAEVSSSPQEALTKLPNSSFDAILCDMWMGEMTGKDFYQAVRKDFPDYQRKVIFVTGDLASEATWDFIDERHLPYILKPFSRPELRRRLLEVVGEKLNVIAQQEAATPQWDGVERRKSRRFTVRGKVRIRRKKWAVGQPEVWRVANASREGIFFAANREYRVGTEVWVAFPFTGRDDDIEQEGFVVRAEQLPNGHWGTAVAMGEAAEASRTKFECSQKDVRRHHILVQTAEPGPQVPPPPPPPASELEAARVAQMEEEARRLAEELAQLKATHDRVVNQRDQLVDHEVSLKEELDELSTVKSTMGSEISDLQAQIGALEKTKAESEEYRFKATHDSLTGMLNRAAIFDVLKRELIRAQREGTFVGVLLADIDHFKKINDVYGHLTGDAVLREVAQRINAAVRTYDSVGRYGGEEFLVVLSGCEEEPVKHAERIRVLVSDEPVTTREGAIPVTLSLGAAISGPDLQEIEELIRAADAALYRAKRGGRNRVEAASVSAAESSSV